MEFSRQEYWSGVPFPPPVDLPNPEIKPSTLALAGRFFTGEALLVDFFGGCHSDWCELLIVVLIYISLMISEGLPRWLSGKESASHTGDSSSIPGLRRSPGEGNGNPLQYSCLENSMDRGAWWATVHGVTKIRTGLK